MAYTCWRRRPCHLQYAANGDRQDLGRRPRQGGPSVGLRFGAQLEAMIFEGIAEGSPFVQVYLHSIQRIREQITKVRLVQRTTVETKLLSAAIPIVLSLREPGDIGDTRRVRAPSEADRVVRRFGLQFVRVIQDCHQRCRRPGQRLQCLKIEHVPKLGDLHLALLSTLPRIDLPTSPVGPRASLPSTKMFNCPFALSRETPTDGDVVGPVVCRQVGNRPLGRQKCVGVSQRPTGHLQARGSGQVWHEPKLCDRVDPSARAVAHTHADSLDAAAAKGFQRRPDRRSATGDVVRT